MWKLPIQVVDIGNILEPNIISLHQKTDYSLCDERKGFGYNFEMFDCLL